MLKQIDLFEDRPADRGLKRRSVRGTAVSMGAQLLTMVIEIAGTMVLARLLFPADFGLLAMVAVFVNSAMTFRDMGLSAGTIWTSRVSHELSSNLFWLNLLFGVSLAIFVACLAPAIALFYGEPRLVPLTLFLVLPLAVSSTTLQHQSLLRRQMRFGRLAVSRVVAVSAGVAVAVSCARFGAGYWALVAQRLTGSVVLALSTWTLCPWIPGPPRRGTGVRRLLVFGGKVTFTRAIQYLMRSADNVLIGFFINETVLGLYSKAYAFLLLPLRQFNTPISHVVVSPMSRLTGQHERYRAYFRKAMETMTFLTMPIVVFAAFAAPDVIRVLLGEKWDAAAPIYRLLAPAAFCSTFTSGMTWIYLSWGHVDRLWRVSLVTGIIGIAGMLIGVQWGVTGVAAAVSLLTLLLTLPQFLCCFHGTPVRLQDLGRAIMRPAAASLLAGGLGWAVVGRTPSPNPGLAGLVIKLAFFGTAYLGLYVLQPGGGRELLDQIRSLRDLLRPRA